MGEWSGGILVNHDKDLPSTVKITVTEAKDGRGMLWSYVFGHQEEKGYTVVTKTVVLIPQEERMRMHFKGVPEQTYLTYGLERVAQDGIGQFSASNCSPAGYCSICTIDLRPSSLSYQWKKTSDGKNFDIYSEFVLTRVIDSNQADPVGSASK